MIKLLPFSSSSTISSIIPTSLHTSNLSRAFSPLKASLTTMSINLHPRAYADNTPLSRFSKLQLSPTGALESLKFQLSESTQPSSTLRFQVLPFRNGRPLASSSSTAHSGDSQQIWHLGWINLGDLEVLLESSGGQLNGDSLVYVGSCSEDDVVYWAIDVSSEQGLLPKLGSKKNFCFVELRSLMVASDCSDLQAIGNLTIAGHARALLEWHNTSQFCGHCGEKTVTIEAGRRKQCSNESCRKRIYSRVDPVVIMLIIDRENDCILLGRKSSFVPRMRSCLAGFIEPGESLEEAVKRETWEEAGVEVGEVVYHSSQPWPVGPSSMPCQLMVGFFAYAKSLDINVDKKELEGTLTAFSLGSSMKPLEILQCIKFKLAFSSKKKSYQVLLSLSCICFSLLDLQLAWVDAQWYSREDVRKALTVAEYKKSQRTAASKVEQMCNGVEKSHSVTADFNVESGELASMFVPGPHAIAHRLISSWAFQDIPNGVPCR